MSESVELNERCLRKHANLVCGCGGTDMFRTQDPFNSGSRHICKDCDAIIYTGKDHKSLYVICPICDSGSTSEKSHHFNNLMLSFIYGCNRCGKLFRVHYYETKSVQNTE